MASRFFPYLALAVALLAGCSDGKTYRLKYAYHTPPWHYELKRFSDFKYEVRKVGETNFTTFRPTAVKLEPNGSVRAEYLIVLPMPQPGEKYESRSSFVLDGKMFDGELRSEVFVTKRPGQ
ncbi:hypothetical protein BH09VER1_BH09VER1_43930 [soil metagenome]